jgi:flavin reductase (DIM6/NTAB) family NADH-FMN oxidoreductase RutF
MAVSGDEFRKALGHLAAGVSVVTTQLPSGSFAGITVTSFTSLSLSPPLVLVCIDKRAGLHDQLAIGQAFAVNLLAAHQEHVSRRFASSAGDQFAEMPHRPGSTGAPILEGALAAIECRVVERHAGGDHTIVVGQVEATHIGNGDPLLHWRGKYGRIVQ